MKRANLLIPFLLSFGIHLNAQTCKDVIGYYPGWQWYDRSHLVNPQTIDYSKYTIINYAFFKPNPDGTIVGTDTWSDEILLLGEWNWSTTPASHNVTTSLPYQAHLHNNKVLMSIGGWTLSDNFPGIAANATKRATFAHSCRELVATYNLDGIDIDWEYPGFADHMGTPLDSTHFTQFLHQIRDTLTVYGTSVNKTMLLTSCFSAATSNMNFIQWNQVVPLLDRINLMSYDFFGSWDPITNHNSPLYAPAQGEPSFNINSAVTTLITVKNVPADKICAGVAFYGRSAVTTGVPALFAAQTGQVDNSTFSQDEGIPQYYNILSHMSLFTPHWDGQAQVPYLTGNGNLHTFVSYDDPQSIGLKAQYIVNHNLRGAIVWEITGDYVETTPGSGVILGTPLADTLHSVLCNSNTPPSNQYPIVSLTSPAANASFNAPATIALAATASDPDGTISKVDFYQNSTLLFSDVTAPYSYSWTNVATGSYVITAKAYDNLNALTISAPITVNVISTNQPPVVTLSSPVNGTVYSPPASILVAATANDPGGSIAKVEFYKNNVLWKTDNSAPYSFQWNNVGVGTYVFYAKAYDNNGATTNSTTSTVTVVNPPPTCNITSPIAGTYFTAPASVVINVAASDPNGTVTIVRFYNGNAEIGKDSIAPYSFTWTGVAAGAYTLKAKAWDNNNAVTTSAPVAITVLAPGANIPPACTLTAPTNNASFNAPASIVLNATASDPDGSIAKVFFYNGNTKIGQDLTAPYTFTWNNVAAGTYALKAKAWDNNNAAVTSNIANITVTAANTLPVVNLTGPANNATYTAPATINITATASDPGGSVAYVQFLQGSTVLGNDSVAPYSWSWTNVGQGTYSLTARAFDNQGSSTTSTAALVTVNAAGGGNTGSCSAPATFFFNPNSYVSLGEIKLGQGQLYPIWGVSVDAFIPTNRLNWAISMVHAAHLFRNLAGTDKIPANFYFATAAKESFCGCDQNIQTAAGQTYPFTYQAASLGDGCFQIENTSAYTELTQLYPQRFPVGGHPYLISGQNFETAALSKAYYDMFAIKWWDVHYNWDPIGFFNNAADPNAAIRLMAVAYNRGLWYGALGTVLNTDRANALASSNIGSYFNDNSYGYDYQNALTAYCLTLNNQTSQLDPSQTAINPATGQPYNYFSGYYDPQVSWSDVNKYIDSITILYPTVNVAILKTTVQSTFNSINNGNSISFRYQLGQVLNTLLLNLPADDPTNQITAIYGCANNSGGGSGNTCSTPSNLTSTNITAHAATITWNATGAIGYTLQYRPANAANWTSLSLAVNYTTLSGLDSCQAYEWKVLAQCSSSSSAYSAVSTFTTAGNCGGGNACITPTGLSATPTNTVASLSWTSTGAASYLVQYKLSSAATWNSVTSNTNSYTLTGLTTCSNYVFKVQGVCSGTSSSAFSVEQSFQTTGCNNTPDPPNNYCSSYSLNATTEWIQHFALSNLDNNSGTNNGFGNFTNMVANLTAGTSYPTTFNAGITGAAATEYWRLLIDFNRDGDFADAGEQVISTTTSGAAIFNATISIPANATNGYARMRLQLKRSGYPTECDIYSGGEVEDYLVLISGGLFAPGQTGLSLLRAELYPNPGNDLFFFSFDLDTKTEVTLELMTLQGDIVASRSLGKLDRGRYREMLDGLAVLPAGLYFAVIRTDSGEKMTKKWVKMW